MSANINESIKKWLTKCEGHSKWSLVVRIAYIIFIILSCKCIKYVFITQRCLCPTIYYTLLDIGTYIHLHNKMLGVKVNRNSIKVQVLWWLHIFGTRVGSYLRKMWPAITVGVYIAGTVWVENEREVGTKRWAGFGQSHSGGLPTAPVPYPVSPRLFKRDSFP